MKKILITGKNSYIGNAVEQWLMKEPDHYLVDKLDMKDASWVKKDFSLYDVVFHVAGIAHMKETRKNRNLYYKINRDLAFESALKASEAGVKQFIFVSSMSVYGIQEGTIKIDTKTEPKNAYGKSKLEAEALILKLKNETFNVSIVRPPMIYGPGCKGNYTKLSWIAKKVPFFPKIDNKRSMLYIDNFSEFIKVLIDGNRNGIFFPQNGEYVNTSDMVAKIASIYNRKLFVTSVFNSFIETLGKTSVISKVFGNLIYDKSLSSFNKNYHVSSFEESIIITEGSLDFKNEK